MNPEFAIELLKTMIFQALTIAAPMLPTAMVVGLAISLFQAVTTIHEQTLAFVPKALAVIAVFRKVLDLYEGEATPAALNILEVKHKWNLN